jgi:hypothetical protein
MKIAYRFFLRLFLVFLAVKLFLGLMGADTPPALLLTSLALVGLFYLWDRWGEELDWRLSRLLIRLNQLPSPPSRRDALKKPHQAGESQDT